MMSSLPETSFVVDVVTRRGAQTGGSEDATPETAFLAMAQLRHSLRCTISLSPEGMSK